MSHTHKATVQANGNDRYHECLHCLVVCVPQPQEQQSNESRQRKATTNSYTWLFLHTNNYKQHNKKRQRIVTTNLLFCNEQLSTTPTNLFNKNELFSLCALLIYSRQRAFKTKRKNNHYKSCTQRRKAVEQMVRSQLVTFKQ